MKRILLFLALMAVILPAFSSERIDQLYYILDSSTKTAEVTCKSNDWENNSTYVSGTLKIPSTVTYNGTLYSVTSIGNDAFHGCRFLSGVEIPNSVTYIGGSAFSNSGLRSVVIPNSVTTVGELAFYFCSNLRSIVIPNSVTTVGKLAFSGCSGLIKSAYPDRFSNPFNYGIAIKYHANTSVIEEGFIYSADKKTIYFAPLKLTGSFVIPNSITSIGEDAFYGCSGLTSVIIPNSVTSIGSSAFNGCSGLIKSAYPDRVSNPFSKGIAIVYPANTSLIEDGFIHSTDKKIIYFVPIELTGTFVIPNSVTSIGNYAFQGCSGLTSVVIPNSVTSIGDRAFLYCSRLTSVVIPNSVTSIGDYAFEYCSGLKSVEIGTSVASIGVQTFFGCSRLTSVEIPNSVTTIGRSAFNGCSSLKSIVIPNSVTSIGNYAFNGCSGLTSVVIPNSVTTIGESAFRDCSGLTRVEIGNSVTSIGNSAFRGCSNLTEVEFNAENCQTCGSSSYLAFPSTLTSVKIGKNVKYIPAYAFYGCSDLISVVIPNSVTSIGNAAFANCSGLTGVLVIPISVNEIGDEAFRNCGLTEIVLERETPPSYYSPFSEYAQTATLTLPDGADINAYLLSDWRNFLSIDQTNGDRVFLASDDVFEYRFIESTGDAFLVPASKYNSMTSASIPDRVVANRKGEESFYKVAGIGPDAFKGCSKLTQVKLPANCEIIGSSAFSGCSGLTTVLIPNSVTSIGNSAFIDCKGLTSVNIADLEAWCRIDFDNASANPNYYAKNLCLNNDTVTSLVIPASLNEIKNYTFLYCERITGEVQIPNAVTSIGNYAFYGCSGLSSVEIPNSVTEIGNNAFYGCIGLARAEIGNSVTSIGNNAFYSCTGLTSIEFPNSVTSIGSSAFNGCNGITSIKIPYSVINIGEQAFANIELENFALEDGIEMLSWIGINNIMAKNLYVGRNTDGSITYSGIENLEIGGFVDFIPADMFNKSTLTSLVVNPGSGIVIGDDAFKGCSSLAEITLPEDIAEIGDGAFSGTALKNVTIPNGLIGANAFDGCNLDNVIIGAGVTSIGEKAFNGSNALNAVYATPTTPPAADNNTFSYYEAQLYVPEEAIDTYYNITRCWYRFSGRPLVIPESIEVTGPTSIRGETGETFRLSATITPANVTLDRVLWSSTNPAVATVDNDGVVTINNFKVEENEMTRAEYVDGVCEIVASTLYEDSPVAVVRIQALSTGIDYFNSDNLSSGWQSGAYNDIYTLQGVCLKRNASQSDIDALTPGIYIIGCKKVMVK